MRNALFMGLITASITHEMQNVMAIIRESGALVGDVMRLNGPPRLKHGDKLQSSLGNIEEQVQRGRELMLMLNGFAHAAEDFPASCDAVRFTAQIAPALQRLARLRECGFIFEKGAAPLFVKGNAMLLMQGIYLAALAVLDVCAPGDTLELATEPGQTPTVILRTRPDRAVPEPSQDFHDVCTGLPADGRTEPGACLIGLTPARAGEEREL